MLDHSTLFCTQHFVNNSACDGVQTMGEFLRSVQRIDFVLRDFVVHWISLNTRYGLF